MFFPVVGLGEGGVQGFSRVECRWLWGFAFALPLLPADGAEYEGEWQADVYEGLGTLTLPSGESYVGHWRAGRKDGTGTHVVPGHGGYTYEGEFQADRHSSTS